MARIKFERVSKRYPNGFTALENLDLDIQDKEFLVLLGPSGCGKSTTLNMIAGLEDVTEGNLFFDDIVMNTVPPHRRDVAMVFQSYALYPHKSVYENIAFGLRMRKHPRDEIDHRVRDAARRLEIEHLLERRPNQLSGGQRQRVALGRAMVRQPSVFLMDEPLSNLDAALRISMRAELKQLHQAMQTTFVYVTHDQAEALTLADRIVVMSEGVVQQIGSPDEIYEHPHNMFVASFLGNPPINYLDGQLVVDGGAVTFRRGGLSLLIPPQLGAVADDIRRPRSHDRDPRRRRLRARCAARRPGIRRAGSPRCCRSGPTIFSRSKSKASNCSSASARRCITRGDIAVLAVNVNRLHVFDKQEQSIADLAEGASMKPASFSYHRPQTLGEALDLLTTHGDTAKIIAGGQSLVPVMNMRLAAPAELIDLNGLPALAKIDANGAFVEVGALTRHCQLVESELVRSRCPLLAQAAETIGHYAIRQRGTLGGSLRMPTRPRNCRWLP